MIALAQPVASPHPLKKPGVLPFAVAITVLNLLGHCLLGFEQPWLTPFVAVGTAYACEMVVEYLINGPQRLRFMGSVENFIRFLLPAHITGLAVGMLMYTNENLVVVAFGSAVAIFSKVLLRVPVAGAPAGTTVHFMNPSNFGIAMTLVAFHWVGVAQPYQFTEEVNGWWDWILPGIIFCSGSFLNFRATKRIVLVYSWLAGFALQAVIRAAIEPSQNPGALLGTMTGMAFVLFTFYMVSDPMTTPKSKRNQVIFGLSTAAVYGVLSYAGVVFGLFFSLCIVCAVRGAILYRAARWP